LIAEPAHQLAGARVNSWIDVQPAARFRRALDVVADNSLWIKNVRDAERLHDSVADVLGWPRSRVFLELGADLGLSGSTYLRHRDACRLHLEDFARFIVEFADHHDFLLAHSFFLSNPDTGQLSLPQLSKEQVDFLVESLIRYVRAITCWQLVDKNRWSIEEALPNLEWGMVISGGSAEHFRELALTVHPYLRDARFVSV
jgi:hypothetical protein